MANNRLVFEGLDELKEELLRLPDELVAEASDIVMNAAEEAKSTIVQRYPLRTGNLREHVAVRELPPTPFGAGAEVRSTARHAHLFEVGTQARHTAIGANRGSMPPGNVFIPTVIRRRRQMYQELKDVLVRHGLEVSGDAE